MDDDFLPLMLIVLAGGAAVWFLMNRAPSTTAAPKVDPPCTVGGSYGGVGLNLSCSAIGKGANALKELGEGVAGLGAKAVHYLPNIIPFGGSSTPVSLEAAVKYANDKGIVYQPKLPTSGWRATGGTAPLPAGYINIINYNMNPPAVFIQAKSGPPKWQGVPPAPPPSA